MIKRHTHLLNEFSRNLSEAKLVNQLQKSSYFGKTLANFENSFTIKEGKNAGKVLTNEIKDSNKIY